MDNFDYQANNKLIEQERLRKEERQRQCVHSYQMLYNSAGEYMCGRECRYCGYFTRE